MGDPSPIASSGETSLFQISRHETSASGSTKHASKTLSLSVV